MLEPNERLFIARRRAKGGLTQEEYARHFFKVSESTYRNYERGHDPLPKSWKVPVIEHLTDVERYVILRQRQFRNRIEMVSVMRDSSRLDLSEQMRTFYKTITVRRILEEESETKRPLALAAWWGDAIV